MPKQKYDFRALKSKYNHDPLPEDINSQIKNLAISFGDNEGLEALKKYRENRYFGEVTLLDSKKRHGAIAYFDHGICFRFEITAYRKNDPLQPLAIQSVKNENLIEEKKKYELKTQRK